jgi:hypothetical protein
MEHRLPSKISCSSCGYTYEMMVDFMAMSLKFIIFLGEILNHYISSIKLTTNLKVEVVH